MLHSYTHILLVETERGKLTFAMHILHFLLDYPAPNSYMIKPGCSPVTGLITECLLTEKWLIAKDFLKFSAPSMLISQAPAMV